MIRKKTLSVNVKLPFNFAVGAVGSRFLKELRDNKKIFATSCPVCKKVLVPARLYCSQCKTRTQKWVELSGKAFLEGWTGGEHDDLVPCLVKLEGADSLFLHRLKKNKETKLKQGVAMDIVWEEERKGSILDIAYFQIANGDAR